MKIAIISDIHDNIPKLRAALDDAREADALICCGDLCSPFIIKEMALGFEGPIHVVFGNNDGDRYRIAAGAGKYRHVHIHAEYAELEFDGCRFSVNHFDGIGLAIASGGSFDVVCFGHNHQFEIATAGRTLIINPGEIYGQLTGNCTYAMYDTKTRTAVRRDIG